MVTCTWCRSPEKNVPGRAVWKGHTDYVLRVVYSDDGKTVVTCSHDKTLKVWDAATGTCRHVTMHSHLTCAMAAVD